MICETNATSLCFIVRARIRIKPILLQSTSIILIMCDLMFRRHMYTTICVLKYCSGDYRNCMFFLWPPPPPPAKKLINIMMGALAKVSYALKLKGLECLKLRSFSDINNQHQIFR